MNACPLDRAATYSFLFVRFVVVVILFSSLFSFLKFFTCAINGFLFIDHG